MVKASLKKRYTSNFLTADPTKVGSIKGHKLEHLNVKVVQIRMVMYLEVCTSHA